MSRRPYSSSRSRDGGRTMSRRPCTHFEPPHYRVITESDIIHIECPAELVTELDEIDAMKYDSLLTRVKKLEKEVKALKGKAGQTTLF